MVFEELDQKNLGHSMNSNLNSTRILLVIPLKNYTSLPRRKARAKKTQQPKKAYFSREYQFVRSNNIELSGILRKSRVFGISGT
jgi:hypothetical protein